jgi:hypothetical protein
MKSKYIYDIRTQPFIVWLSGEKIFVKDERMSRMVGVWDKVGYCRYKNGVFLSEISPSVPKDRFYLYIDSKGVYTFKSRVKLYNLKCPISDAIQYPYAHSQKWICLLTLGVFLKKKEVKKEDPYDFYYNNWDALRPITICSYERKTIVFIDLIDLDEIDEIDDIPVEENYGEIPVKPFIKRMYEKFK